MPIDWFTVIAQIVNFLVLVLLLKHFLFGKIIGAMEEREKSIASAMEEADSMRKRAEEDEQRHLRMNKELEESRIRFLDTSKQEAQSIRTGLIDNARAEVEDLKAIWRESITREKNSFLVELRCRIAKEAVIVVRSALLDLANVELEQRIVDVFLEKFRAMPKEKIVEIRNIIEKTSGEVTVITAFDLAEDQKEAIAGLLRGRIAQHLRTRFEMSDDHLCGVELRFQGYKVGWSIDAYVRRLEQAITEALEVFAGRSRVKIG